MNWGATYRGTARKEDMLAGLDEFARRNSLWCAKRALSDGTVHVHMRQTRPPWQVILLALPQRLDWYVQEQEGRVTVTCDSRLFVWYAWLVVLLCATESLLLKLGLSYMFGPWEARNWGSLCLSGVGALLGIGLIFGNYRLILAASHRQFEDVWNMLMTRASDSGGWLEPEHSGTSRRHLSWSLGYIVFVLATLAWAVFPAFSKRSLRGADTPLWGALSALAALLLLLLFCALPATVLKRGFGKRMLPALPGATVLIGCLFFLVAELPWFAWSEPAREIPIEIRTKGVSRALAEEKEKRRRAPRIGSHWDPGKVAAGAAALRFVGWVALATSAGGLLVGIAFLAAAAMCALRIRPLVHLLVARPSRGRTRPAASGAGFLLLFRTFLVLLWSVLSLLVLPSACLLVCAALSATGHDPPLLSSTAADAVNASMVITGLAFDIPSHGLVLGAFLRCSWALAGAACLSLFGASMLSLWLSRRRTLRRLTRSTHLTNDTIGADGLIRELAKRAGMPCPTAAVSNATVAFAFAHSFGGFRRRQFIEVSKACFGVLQQDELTAIIAHEMAHLELGHCRRDNLLRWLGRLTLVGDSFSRCVQDSTGHEMAADHEAVVRFSADPLALRRALWKLGALRAITALSGSAGGTGFSSLALDEDQLGIVRQGGVGALPFTVRWRAALRAFLGQYTASENIAYYYPATDERVAAVSRMAGLLSHTTESIPSQVD